uniref:TAFH domain-containing protein n=1 Tax=Panagrolaimus superbus TaxID=310955 RepID=A0A914YI06_9BILA
MEYGSYGMHPGQFQPATPRPQMVVTLNDKFGSFFNELLKLATLKSNPSYSVFYIRKYIQDLLRGTLSLEDFVLQLRDIFGSHQPHLLHFLKSEHFFTQPYSLESPEGQAVANGDQYFPNGNESFKSEEQIFW